MWRWLRKHVSGGQIPPPTASDGSVAVKISEGSEHRIVSVNREVKAVPMVDGDRMRAEWHGGPYLMKDVDREVFVIRCSCGEDGFAFLEEHVQEVYASHLREVTFP